MINVIKKNEKSFLLKYASILAMCLLFLNSSSIYTNFYVIIARLSLIISFAIIFLMCLFSIKKLVVAFMLPLAFAFTIFILISSFLTTFDTSQFNVLIKFFALFFLINILTINGLDILSIVYSVLKIFCIRSCINYFLDITGLVTYFPITNEYITNWGGRYNLYCFVFFRNYMESFSIGSIHILKMHAPFSEAGVAQLFYNFGLLFSLFFKTKKRIFWTIIFSICSLLTFSLTGVAIILIIYFFYLIKEKKGFLVLPFIFLFLPLGIIMLVDKLGSNSYVERLADYKFIFNFSIENLPFGIGLQGDLNILYTEFNNLGLRVQGGFYSGLFTPLALFGYLSVFYYYFFLVGILNFFKGFSFELKTTFIFLIIVTLLTEPLTFSTIILFVIIFGFINKNLNNATLSTNWTFKNLSFEK